MLIKEVIIVIIFTSCGFDCIDRKTGLSKSSQSIKESKQNGIFMYEIPLDSGEILTINNAWVENRWSYEWVNNKYIVKKDKLIKILKFTKQ